MNETSQVKNSDNQPVVILTGLSGAGKTSVINVFEDLGFFAIDGLPLDVLPGLLPSLEGEAMSHYRGLILGLDFSREEPGRDVAAPLAKLREQVPKLSVLFVDAENVIIMRRYAATRRPHPLYAEGQELGLEQAVCLERARLEPVKTLADKIIDTSVFSIHDLRRYVMKHYASGNVKNLPLRVHLVSFGFKYGMPAEADMMFDLRFLPNPFFVEELRHLSGMRREVSDYVLGDLGRGFLERLEDFMDFVLPLFLAEGRHRMTIAFGCTGGRHRSVAVTEKVGTVLRQKGYAVSIEHRHLELG